MKRTLSTTLVVLAAAAFAFAASAQPKAQPKAKSTAAEIASAESAAPPSIGRHATIVSMDAKGAMTTLRKGDNGWTCLPDDPNTPGKDPMCTDKNGMAWMDAMMTHKPPPGDVVGMAYMLKGGSDASNLDPFANKPVGGKWIATGPHVMILNAHVAEASGYPSKQAAPDTTHPYVMFGGTPYAHIMMPTM